MFKRYEHRGHVLLKDIQVLPVPIQPKTFRFPQRCLLTFFIHAVLADEGRG